MRMAGFLETGPDFSESCRARRGSQRGSLRRRTACQDVGHIDQRGLRGRGVDRKERVGADRDEEVVVGIERDAEARCFEASRPDRDG